MKSAVSTIFALVIGLCCAAGSPPAAAQPVEKVALPTARAVGEAYVVEVRATKTRTRGGQSTSSGSTWRLKARIEEMRADGGHVLRLETTDVDLAMPPETAKAGGMVKVVNDAVRRLMHVPIVLDMAPEGAVEGLRNTDQALAFAKDLIAAVKSEMVKGNDKVDPALLDRIFAPLTQSTYLEGSMIEPFALLFFMSGVELEVGEAYAMDDQVPFPLTGTPLRSRILFAATEIDRDAGTVTFDWRREVDQEDFRKGVRDFVARMMKSAGKEMPPDDQLPFDDFVLDAEATYVYSLTTGLPISMRYRKTVSAPGGGQVETKDIDVLPGS